MYDGLEPAAERSIRKTRTAKSSPGRSLARCPAEIVKRWKVLPYKVAAGHLFVAGSELPSDEMHDALRKFSSLEIRFHLVTPTEFEELAHEYLPQ